MIIYHLAIYLGTMWSIVTMMFEKAPQSPDGSGTEPESLVLHQMPMSHVHLQQLSPGLELVSRPRQTTLAQDREPGQSPSVSGRCVRLSVTRCKTDGSGSVPSQSGTSHITTSACTCAGV